MAWLIHVYIIYIRDSQSLRSLLALNAPNMARLLYVDAAWPPPDDTVEEHVECGVMAGSTQPGDCVRRLHAFTGDGGRT